MKDVERKDWKGEYKNLEGRIKEIQEYKNEAKKFNNKILSIERIHLWVAFTLVVITAFQGYMLYKQNELFNIQNRRLDQQTYLLEAERRGALVHLLSNVLNLVDQELKEDFNNNKIRDLSPQTIGRIISLSKALKPYRYLENDILITNSLSPERGQLLISLLSAKINNKSLDEIFRKGNFQHSDLKNTKLIFDKWSQINLRGSNLKSSVIHVDSMTNSSFYQVNLKNTTFHGKLISKCDFQFSNLTGATFFTELIQNSNFNWSPMNNSSFAFSKLSNVNLSGAFLNKADFSFTKFFNVDFHYSKLDSVKSEIPFLEKMKFSEKFNYNIPDRKENMLRYIDEYYFSSYDSKVRMGNDSCYYLIEK